MLKKIRTYTFLLLLTVATVGTSCKQKDGTTGVNIFTIEDDKALGEQVKEEIESDPANYPILSESQYPEAYTHFRRIANAVLTSGKVTYADDFNWEFKIIHNDSVLNAFCTPGGKIYFYTGIIKFLDSEDQLAGVMGHEIAHADKRHSTEQLTRIYGVSLLLDIALGTNRGQIADIAAQLVFLNYNRSQESEADMFSVEYLYPTEYDARGAARFFEKIEEAGGGGGPVFLSTHPDPSDRVEKIKEKWESMGAKEGGEFVDRYQQFKNSLPQ